MWRRFFSARGSLSARRPFSEAHLVSYVTYSPPPVMYDGWKGAFPKCGETCVCARISVTSDRRARKGASVPRMCIDRRRKRSSAGIRRVETKSLFGRRVCRGWPPSLVRSREEGEEDETKRLLLLLLPPSLPPLGGAPPKKEEPDHRSEIRTRRSRVRARPRLARCYPDSVPRAGESRIPSGLGGEPA